MSKSKDKRLVYVPGDLVDEIKEVSRRRGESLSLFVSEVLKMALKADRMGFDPKEAADFLEILQAQRNLGGAFMPADVLDYLNSKSCKDNLELLETKWYDSGVWHGKYLKEKFDDPVQAFRKFLVVTRWDLSEVEVKQNDDGLKFRCISTLLTGEETKLLARFIEGAMHGMGYRTGSRDTLKGMILLDFKK